MVGVCLTVIGLIRVIITNYYTESWHDSRWSSRYGCSDVSHIVSHVVLGVAFTKLSPDVSYWAFRRWNIHSGFNTYGDYLFIHCICNRSYVMRAFMKDKLNKTTETIQFSCVSRGCPWCTRIDAQ
jgi:hypothetical protein